jgi:hypothetical protein
MTSIHEVEAWAGGLLEKCAQLKGLVENTGAVSTIPSRQPSQMTIRERADLAAKLRARWTKPNT